VSKLEIQASRTSIRIAAEGTVAVIIGSLTTVMLIAGCAFYFLKFAQ